MKMDDHGQLTGIQNFDLPPEIMHDIFSRLPVKPLFRFKCVSKTWRSLISDPDFVAYYSKAIENKNVFFIRRRLFFTYKIIFPRDRPTDFGVYSLDLDQFLNENPNVDLDGLVAPPTKLDLLRKRGRVPDLNAEFHCPCYDLLLCEDQSRANMRLSLINPVTKESKKLPKAPEWRLPLKPIFWHLYGCGFVHSTNEYKVINGQEYKDEGIVFSVYTLQTNSWRQIDHLYPYTEIFHIKGILVNGAVHWLMHKRRDGSPVIVSFLLAEEEVREIALPPNAPADANYYCLGLFRNSLCIRSSRLLMFQEIWFMKEYGVSESWIVFQLSRPFTHLSHSGFWTESHDLLVFERSSFVMYNFNDGTYWNLSVGDISGGGDFQSVGIYVESIPSPVFQNSIRGAQKMNPLSNIFKKLFSCFYWPK